MVAFLLLGFHIQAVAAAEQLPQARQAAQVLAQAAMAPHRQSLAAASRMVAVVAARNLETETQPEAVLAVLAVVAQVARTMTDHLFLQRQPRSPLFQQAAQPIPAVVAAEQNVTVRLRAQQAAPAS